MDLTHRFSVPTGVEETWAHFQDIASVAECFPGASVSSVEGDSFAGSVKVKLGPIALVYNGSGTFVEKDESAHRFVVEAKGKDKRGNGTAGATVTLTMTPAGTATDVEVVTDLAITGKPAQFGRGVMQDVSDKLLGQFVACLEERLSAPAPDSAGESSPEPVVPDESAAGEPESRQERQGEGEDRGARAGTTAGLVTDAMAAETPAPQPNRPELPRQSPPPRQPARPTDDALDLGGTVLPVLAKTYWKQALGAGVAVAVVVWWVSRRS